MPKRELFLPGLPDVLACDYSLLGLPVQHLGVPCSLLGNEGNRASTYRKLLKGPQVGAGVSGGLVTNSVL